MTTFRSAVVRDPDGEAPDRQVCTLITVKDFSPVKVWWACTSCKISVLEFTQPRCFHCGSLMQLAKELS